ncbi:MAG: serine/threonine protein kinase [Myxococcales bacterium]|nr:serine/threonine protein kinase [Myxococcales bacterium]
MGHVYRATQAPINREVAIKVLRVDLAHQEGVAERFKREARAASMIQHPNAITIFDFDQDGDILYLAMEFLSGETLRQRLRRDPPMEIQEALDMFEAMAGALGAAHKVGVVHRDLKPDNIFLAKFDAVGQVVKVLDFGLAKLLDRAADNDGLVTEANLRLGTPRYMAPEQALGIQPIDSRCDVYALGLLLYEMLAQRAPFVGDDGMEVLAQRLRREAPRISTIVPAKNFGEQIDELLASMLKRDRDQRPQDANVVLQKLRDIRKANQVFRVDESAQAADAHAGGGRSHEGIRPVRPATAGAIAAIRPGGPASKPAEAMVRLDQDDFPEKPTVVVDPGAMDSPAAMAAAALGRSSPGMHAMASAPSGPPMPQQSSYAAAAASQMGVPALPPSGQLPYAGASAVSNTTLPSAGLSAERSQAATPGRRRTLLIVVAVIVIAVLAPVIALIVRSTSSRGGDDHGDPTGGPDTPPKKLVTPPKDPTPKDPEVKSTPDPTPDPPSSDPNKGGKKGKGGKTKSNTKPKDSGKKESPKKEASPF